MCDLESPLQEIHLAILEIGKHSAIARDYRSAADKGNFDSFLRLILQIASFLRLDERLDQS